VAQWWASLTDLTSMTAASVYLVVLGLVFVESGLLIGFFLPGDSVLFAAGLLSAEPGSGISMPLLAGTVAVAAVAGDAVGYWSGRRFGRPWLLRRAGRAARHVERAESFYQRWGALAVIVARFIPWVRTFTPIVAGVSNMEYRTFVRWNVVGGTIWAFGVTLLGYFLGQVDVIEQNLELAILAVVAVSCSPIAIEVLRARRERRAVNPG
jgi:membrane-associated protein